MVHCKMKLSRFRGDVARLVVLSLVFQQVAGSAAVFGHDGAAVVGGAATIAQQGSTLNVTTQTDRTIINWDSFGVPTGHTANFQQPNASSAVLNRVIAPNNPSGIYGTLNSNGNVYLLNPAGVVVGPSGVINTNGFTASVLDIPDQEFLNGGALHFRGSGTGSILNQGTITTGTGGTTLIGGQVINEGLIQSGGSINLITGGSVQLDNGGTYTQADAATVQHGVSPTAGLIQNSGTIRATGALEVGGEVYLVSPGGKVLQEGLIAAKRNSSHHAPSDAASNSGVGGKVVVTGGEVALDGATIDVSGTDGGGEAYVGGGFQGNDPDVLNATYTTVDETTTLIADALITGNGGTVVVWSNESTSFAGTITARGGQQSGNGGLVEISGMALTLTGMADTTAANGDTGWLLLDPLGIEVLRSDSSVATFGPSLNPRMRITDTFLNFTLSTSNVLLATTPSEVAYNASVLPFAGSFGGPTANDDTIRINADALINTNGNTLYLSTSTLDLLATINGNVSGGIGSPFTPTAVTLKDPTTVNVGANSSLSQAQDIIADGGTIGLGAGTYSSFEINRAGLTFAGQGASTIVQSSSPAITVNANGTTITGLNLVGTGAIGDIGILLDGTASPNLTGITINDVNINDVEDGIVAQGIIGTGLGTDVSIDDVTMTNILNDGIRFNSTSTAIVEILNSDIGTSGNRVGNHGLNLQGLTGGTADFTLQGNNVFAAEKAVNVFSLEDGAILDIAGGNYDGTTGGLLVRNSNADFIMPDPSGNLELSDSTFVGGAGSAVVDLRHDATTFFGPIPLPRAGVDITISPDVVISGGATGLALTRSRINLVGDTLSNLALNGQTGNYIDLSSTAEFFPGTPNLIDANAVTFDGLLADDMNASQLIALENKIDHFPDNLSTGFINFGAVVIPASSSIQLGVNFAGNIGIGKVVVPNGLYGGSVEVWVDDLELLGEGAGAIVNANAVDPFANNGDRDNGFEVVDLGIVGPGGDVTGVTIDGFSFASVLAGQTNTGISLGTGSSAAIDTTIQNSFFNSLLYGIEVTNVGGTTSIQDVSMLPFLFSPTVFQGIRFVNDLNNVEINIDNANIIADSNAIRVVDGLIDSELNISDSSLVSNILDAILFRDTIDNSDVTISGSTILGNDDGINIDGIDGGNFTVENNILINGQNGSGIEFDDLITGSNIQIDDNLAITGDEEAIEFDTSVTGSLVGISGNGLISAGLDAIQFKDSVNLSLVGIADNGLINSVSGEGIVFEDEVNLSLMSIGNNTAITSLSDSIFFADSVNLSGILLFNNNILSSAADGVSFLDEVNVSAIGIVGNRIGASGEAIQFHDNINVSLIGVLGNITGSNGSGIAFSDRGAANPVISDSLVFVNGNTIAGPIFPLGAAPDFGIQFEGIDGSSTVVVADNNVLASDNDGLLVQDFVSGNSLLDINNNTFGAAASRMGVNGIDIDLVDSTRGVRIMDNTIFASENAIQLDDDLVNTIVNIDGNTLDALNTDGIQIEGSILGATELTVSNNQMIAGRHGFGQMMTSSIEGDAVVRVEDNLIQPTGLMGSGILLQNIGSSVPVVVSSNTTTGGQFGLQVVQSGASGLNGHVVLSDLTINSATDAGIRIENTNMNDSLETTVDSGIVIDGSNTTMIGLVFSGENLTVTGNTLNDLQFANMPGNFIELQNGGLFQPGMPTLIDATHVDFDGIDTNSLPGFIQVTNRIIDFIDDPTLGLIYPGFQPNSNLTYDRFGRYDDYFRTLDELLEDPFYGAISISGGPPSDFGKDPQSEGTVPGMILRSTNLSQN